MGNINTTQHPIVGTVRWKPTSTAKGSPITLLDDWEQKNLVSATIPQLQGVLDARTDKPGDKFKGQVKFYKPAMPQLLRAFAEIEEQGLAGLILSYAGTFYPRLKRGSSTSPSNHSFGTAIDINSEWNGFKQKPAKQGAKGSVILLVPIFEKYGFEWGGNWSSTPDGMHFEVEKILPTVGSSDDDSELEEPHKLVTVSVNGVKTSVFGMLMMGKAYVGVRALSLLLGGQVTAVSNPLTTVEVSFGDQKTTLAATNFGAVGAVWARDLADAADMSVSYDHTTGVLDFKA